MLSSVPIPGNPWPHDMVLTIENDSQTLLDLLWVREGMLLVQLTRQSQLNQQQSRPLQQTIPGAATRWLVLRMFPHETVKDSNVVRSQLNGHEHLSCRETGHASGRSGLFASPTEDSCVESFKSQTCVCVGDVDADPKQGQ